MIHFPLTEEELYEIGLVSNSFVKINDNFYKVPIDVPLVNNYSLF